MNNFKCFVHYLILEIKPDVTEDTFSDDPNLVQFNTPTFQMINNNHNGWTVFFIER